MNTTDLLLQLKGDNITDEFIGAYKYGSIDWKIIHDYLITKHDHNSSDLYVWGYICECHSDLTPYEFCDRRKAAIDYYKRAADLGNPFTQYGYGSLRQSDYGKTPDYEEGLKYIKLAADQGYSCAQNRLGTMYHMGYYNTEKDFENATIYYKLAINGGHTGAKNNFANLCKDPVYKNMVLSAENEQLKNTVKFLQTQLDFMPGGVGYYNSLERVERLEKQNNAIYTVSHQRLRAHSL